MAPLARQAKRPLTSTGAGNGFTAEDSRAQNEPLNQHEHDKNRYDGRMAAQQHGRQAQRRPRRAPSHRHLATGTASQVPPPSWLPTQLFDKLLHRWHGPGKWLGTAQEGSVEIEKSQEGWSA